VHPDAILIGDVIIGEKCFIGAGAVLRGDYGSIVIGDGSNVQENCVLHAQPDTTATIEENVDIGHGSIIHGPCTIKSNVTVGMGSIICDGCEVGTGSFIGAGSLLTPNVVIPPNKLAVGNPARVIKDTTEQHRTFSRHAVGLYQGLCERYQKSHKLIQR
jgi:carbonic anhydrase/acetyltransferase-like protein (isoleucine patch superfamily)